MAADAFRTGTDGVTSDATSPSVLERAAVRYLRQRASLTPGGEPEIDEARAMARALVRGEELAVR